MPGPTAVVQQTEAVSSHSSVLPQQSPLLLHASPRVFEQHSPISQPSEAQHAASGPQASSRPSLQQPEVS
ncbi:MAG: hypothetical protein U0168_21340 [Nannocystaceae bacterium]